jgi:lambda repressor-like predicted transcriptional regulator
MAYDKEGIMKKLLTPLEIAVKVFLVRDGLSLRGLARTIGTTHQSLLQRLANHEPLQETVETLADGLGVSPKELKAQMVMEWKNAKAAGRELACPPRIKDPAKSIIDLV